MFVLILNILIYGHDALMLLLYYSKTLKRRYSLKITVMGTVGWWILQSACKLPPMYLGEDYNMTFIMIAQCLLMLIYLLIFYSSSMAKKFPAFMLVTATLGVAEFTTILIAGNFADFGSRPLQLGSEFTTMGLLIMRPLAVLAYFGAFLIWNILQRSSWVRGGRQWLCALLPFSQLFLLWYLTEAYTNELEGLPALVLAGVFLAVAGDIYMFIVFDQAQEREQIERELSLQKHLHELEQVRYDRLRDTQEETARLRHDFQNYLLTLRSMSRKEAEGEGKSL